MRCSNRFDFRDRTFHRKQKIICTSDLRKLFERTETDLFFRSYTETESSVDLSSLKKK